MYLFVKKSTFLLFIALYLSSFISVVNKCHFPYICDYIHLPSQGFIRE